MKKLKSKIKTKAKLEPKDKKVSKKKATRKVIKKKNPKLVADPPRRRLSWDRINELATSSPKIHKIAVENFLSTVHGTEHLEWALINLNSDARGYGWNLPTKNAIRIGILEHFRL